MRHGTLVGYSFNADLYCPDCMAARATYALEEAAPGASAAGLADGFPDQIVGHWARSLGIDREDESTFDSGDFPKVLFYDHIVDRPEDRCGSCHELLLD